MSAKELVGFWGKSVMAFDSAPSVGRSGGLISMWDRYMFQAKQSIKDKYFILVLGNCQGVVNDVIIVNVYAPQEHSLKVDLWEKLVALRNSMQGVWVFAGDFNAVRVPSDRLNSVFCGLSADEFLMILFT